MKNDGERKYKGITDETYFRGMPNTVGELALSICEITPLAGVKISGRLLFGKFMADDGNKGVKRGLVLWFEATPGVCKDALDDDRTVGSGR
jgi:hypothetical protein